MFQFHNTALNIGKQLQDQLLHSDTNASTIICDNSANVHICNDKKIFVGPLRHTDHHFVTNISGSKNVSIHFSIQRFKWHVWIR